MQGEQILLSVDFGLTGCFVLTKQALAM